MNHLYKNRKLQLQSTNYLRNLQFPTHDYPSEQQQTQLSELSHNEQTENSQLSDYSDCEDINEDAIINLPIPFHNLYLVSSFKKVTQNDLIKSIDNNKSKYNELMKKKQQNRQKFIQKINQNLTDSQPLFLSNPSAKNLKLEKDKRSVKLKNQPKNKIPRSQTQEHKLIRNETVKEFESNWDKGSQIDFNLTSQRQETEENFQQNSQSQKSEKKKITIKRKGSVNSNIKQKSQQKVKQSRYEKEQSNKNDPQLNKSINEFMFLEQYQKDNKELMNRLLTIIEQDHANRVGNGSINQNMARESDTRLQQMSKLQQSYHRPSKMLNMNQIETAEYSSVKPIVINNYIKSPTQFMGKGLIQKQMAIRMLEQNRGNKKSIMSSIVDSRVLQESSIVAIPSRQYSASKRPSKQDTDLKSKIQPSNKIQHQVIKPEQTENVSTKDQNDIDFQLLYQKLKNQLQNQKLNPKPQSQTEIQKPQSETSLQSQLLPINSSRHPQPLSGVPSSLETHEKTFDTHNVSQNLKQFNPNSSIQSSENFNSYNFKKPSVSMEIHFGKDENEPKENISLADAFKKKFGAGNKFGAKGKASTKEPETISKSRQALSELKDHKKNVDQSAFKIPEDAYNGNFLKKETPSARKTIKISKKQTQAREKQNINSLQTPRSHSEHYNSLQHSQSISTKLSKQPSKQLLDRLIYGQKATMTKKEMYELSKKNYMKLPEIQEKRKQQQKRLKQLQKKEKIKEYQKRIRSGKNSIAKDSLRASLESSMVRLIKE